MALYQTSMEYRIERDSIGEVKVESTKYWAAQTQRSLENFKIGNQVMPLEIIKAFGVLKKCAALTNYELGVLSKEKAELIAEVCDEIIAGKLNDEFPLVIWQTGSGTQSNMNVNEVIANRGHVLKGGSLMDNDKFLHPNDDVNKSQSSNDTFPTAMSIAVYKQVVDFSIPGLQVLKDTFKKKAREFKHIVKIGRTHFMDATPLTLGQEFSGYRRQLEMSIIAIENAMVGAQELALGGTAVGTGLNAPKGYAELVANKIAEEMEMPFRTAVNKFEALAAHDAMVELHGALKRAVKLGAKLDWASNEDFSITDNGPKTDFITEYELKNGLGLPPQTYASMEDGLRARLKMSVADYAEYTSKILSNLSEVASKNEYAQFPKHLPSSFLSIPSRSNYRLYNNYLK